MLKALHIEATQSFEEGATFTPTAAGGLVVSVAEEKAVDSYNHSFECKLTMTPTQVAQLRDWLEATFNKRSIP